LQSIYVRPEGRTLQKHEFFRNCKAVPFVQQTNPQISRQPPGKP
jgi:hypothetical protein